MKLHLFLFALVSAVSSSHGDVTLPALFSDNMVLQQKAKDNVWGKAQPGEKVTVSVAGRTATAITNQDGRWSVALSPIKAGGPFDMTVSGSNTITIHNVAAGEVWIAAGQSNMEFKMADVDNASQEIDVANAPMIRLFTVPRKGADEPQSDCDGKWEICDPKTVKTFSAVGYFFADELNKKLKYPVGIIHSSWGGSPVESWTPRAGLESDSVLKPILGKVATTEEKEVTTNPPRPADSQNALKPMALFNGMIAPLIPYSVKGAIWYQGEANANSQSQALKYRNLFPALITSWRKAWGEGDFPFLFVQLSSWRPSPPRPSESAWAILREAQAMALKLPKTGMAVSIDIGDRAHPMNIHPHNKKEVGHRLALIARATVYGDDKLTYSGPVYASMKAKADKIELTFKETSNGLIDKNGPPLNGFAIAGTDKKFVWAEAQIEGKKVVVHADEIAKPVTVRYAWGETPDCDLCNQDGLPAAPFRTDDWNKVPLETKTTPSPALPESTAPTPAPALSPSSTESPAPASTPEPSASPVMP